MIDPIDKTSIAITVMFEGDGLSSEVYLSVHPESLIKAFLNYALIIGTNKRVLVKVVSSNNISIDNLIMSKILRHAIVAEQFDYL